MSEMARDRIWTRSYTFILVSVFGISLVTNMFNLGMTYYADLVHGGIELAGVSAGAFSMAGLASRPVAAWISNRFNCGKVMTLASLSIAVAAYAHCYASTIPLLAVFRVIHGFLFGIFSTAAGAATNTVLPRSRLSEGLGFYSVVSMLVPAVGPAIFLMIIEEGDLASFGGLFSLSFGVCIATAAVAFFGIPAIGAAGPLSKEKLFLREDGPSGNREVDRGVGGGAVADRASGGQLPKTYLGFEPRTLLPASLLCLFCMAYSSVNFYLPELAFEKDLGDISAVYLVFAGMSILCRFVVGGKAKGRVLDRYLYIGMVCLALSYAVVPLCPNAWCLCLVAVPLGVGMGLVAPFLNCYIVGRCSRQRPGSASAAYYAAYDVGYSIGAFAAGAIIAGVGYTVLYGLATAVCVVGLVLFRLLLAGKSLEDGVS